MLANIVVLVMVVSFIVIVNLAANNIIKDATDFRKKVIDGAFEFQKKTIDETIQIQNEALKALAIAHSSQLEIIDEAYKKQADFLVKSNKIVNEAFNLINDRWKELAVEKDIEIKSNKPSN